ncbi:hydroxypyruvate reductase [Labrys miyagiensis]|uniref:Hydroxypyruvate reductase n=1 Tax=Labrys miyagiensis TaxID=346912 RepID=A0ABQ6CQN0_9HYPH|nr:glycerate kinase [Labrys miyagiensis]GLS22125.1 hydroxypyruvate reductase [Labrys miyagiensis]
MPDHADTQRAVLDAIFTGAVAASHPASFLPSHLPSLPATGRLVIIAAGKAGGSMAEVAEAHYAGLGLPTGRISGVAVARHGYGRPLKTIPMIEAGHPVPDAGSVEGATRALEAARSAGPDDLVLVLLSGGASANLVAPAGDLTLDDKRAITRHLLRSGAAIGEINVVRKRLSRIKGGRLAQAAHPARLLTLAVSDVPGDDPAIIGSGPTVPDPASNAQALAIADRFNTPLGAARSLFEDAGNETPKPGDAVFANSEFHIVATPAQMIAAAIEIAAQHGYEPVVLGANVEGEARSVAADQAKQARALKAAGRKAALISGGELTVTITGKGRGGPNQEFSLALALALGGEPGISALAADTDGTDGGGGLATDPAGAIIDPTTLARARAGGVDPEAYLANNDSTGFFEAIGDLVAPGPTFTNVNDLRVILVG